jgi:hypothetical protein
MTRMSQASNDSFNESSTTVTALAHSSSSHEKQIQQGSINESLAASEAACSNQDVSMAQQRHDAEHKDSISSSLGNVANHTSSESTLVNSLNGSIGGMAAAGTTGDFINYRDVEVESSRSSKMTSEGRSSSRGVGFKLTTAGAAAATNYDDYDDNVENQADEEIEREEHNSDSDYSDNDDRDDRDTAINVRRPRKRESVWFDESEHAANTETSQRRHHRAHRQQQQQQEEHSIHDASPDDSNSASNDQAHPMFGATAPFSSSSPTRDEQHQSSTAGTSSSDNSAFQRITLGLRSYFSATNAAAKHVSDENAQLRDNSLSPWSLTAIATSSSLSDIIYKSTPVCKSNFHSIIDSQHHDANVELLKVNIAPMIVAKSKSFSRLIEKLAAESSASLQAQFGSSVATHLYEQSDCAKLVKLFKTYESYYSTMFTAIADNYTKPLSTRLDLDYCDAGLSLSPSSDDHSKEEILNNIDSLETLPSATAMPKATTAYEDNENSSSSSSWSSWTGGARRPLDNLINKINLFGSYDDFREKLNDSLSTKRTDGTSNEFYSCSICAHCLDEPITLVCGCTYCKTCLNEFNKTLQHLFNTHDTEAARVYVIDDTATTYLFKCFNCSRSHSHNNIEHLKPNKFISKLVEKLWPECAEVKKLRDDLRSYVCLDVELNKEIDLLKYEFLFNAAYQMGKDFSFFISN